MRSYYVTNSHMPIVSRQDWDKAQLMLHSGRFPNTYRTFLSGKIYCDLCGASFGRQLWHSTTTPERVWRCYNSIHRNGTCPALHVYEAELVEAVKLSVLQLAYKYLAKLSALLNNLPKPPENKKIAFNQYISSLPSQVQIDETICDVDLRILLSKVIVLESGNVLIRFIDGTEYLQEII